MSLSEDKNDWEKLSSDERHFISRVLAFFAGSDGIIQENLARNFLDEIGVAECRAFFSIQLAMEQIHNEQYSILIESLIKDEAEKNRLLRAIETIPSVGQKAAFGMKYMTRRERFCTRLAAFVCVEGILFSASFCAIYWLKKRGIMPGLTLSNVFIARDESLHAEFGAHLYRTFIVHKLPESAIHGMVRECVDVERSFVRDSLPVSLIGMSSSEMIKYIEFIADTILLKLGYAKLFKTPNPFDWMVSLGLENKSNFFERFPSEYQKAAVIEDFALDDVF